MRLGATSARTPAEADKSSDTQRAKQRPQLWSTAAAVGSKSAATASDHGATATKLLWVHGSRSGNHDGGYLSNKLHIPTA